MPSPQTLNLQKIKKQAGLFKFLHDESDSNEDFVNQAEDFLSSLDEVEKKKF